MPVWARWTDLEWQVERARHLGHRAVDSTGWKGPVRRQVGEAAADARARRAQLEEEG